MLQPVPWDIISPVDILMAAKIKWITFKKARSISDSNGFP